MSRLPGRPREFDTDAAIDSALLVFRERGYHATSIKELSDATGLTAGSLYKAFGSKNGLFLAAFDRYTRTRSAALRQRTEAARSGRDKIAAVLRFYAESSHGPEGIRGCLVVASATELAVFDEATAQYIKAAMQRTEQLLLELVQEGQRDGSLSRALPTEQTARNLFALLQGYRVIGKKACLRTKSIAPLTRHSACSAEFFNQLGNDYFLLFRRSL